MSGGSAMSERTVEPYDVHFVPEEALGGRGRLGMTAAPGRIEPEALEADLNGLKEEGGAQVLVSLMETEEYEMFGIGALIERARTAGLEVLHLPIPDGGTPAYAGLEEHHRELVDEIVRFLEKDKTVVIHCLGGMGRTGLVAASVLIALEHPADEAIRLVQEARPGTIENEAQMGYVRDFEIEVRGENERTSSPDNG